MNAMTSIAAAKPLDDIRCFLPGIDDAEYALREKLRRHRNVAAAMLATTESPTARQFAWVVNDYVSELIFAPAAPLCWMTWRSFAPAR